MTRKFLGGMVSLSGNQFGGFDAWVMLAAAAMRTERIRLGTMITPVSRMRPWKLASETVALDHLSRGRLTISVGLGAIDNGFEAFGEVLDRKTRAELLDEGLDILTGLWRGQPFTYQGKHYHIKESSFYPPPPPLQQPRNPIWVVGAWARMRSMRRALRYDGLTPATIDSNGTVRNATPDEVHRMKKFIEANRPREGSYDIVVEGRSLPDDPSKAAELVRPWYKVARLGGWLQVGAQWTNPNLWKCSGRESCMGRRSRTNIHEPYGVDSAFFEFQNHVLSFTYIP